MGIDCGNAGPLAELRGFEYYRHALFIPGTLEFAHQPVRPAGSLEDSWLK
jgi:hypothetical protein